MRWLESLLQRFGIKAWRPAGYAGLTRQVEVGGMMVTAHEMTTLQTRNWLKAQSRAADFDVVDSMLFERFEVTAADMLAMSDITRRQLDAITPSMAEGLAAAIKEVNPHFFQMRQRLIGIGTTLAAS